MMDVLDVIVQNSVNVMERPVIRPLDGVSVHLERQENAARKVHTNTPYASYANSHKPLFKLSNLRLLSQFVMAGFMVQGVLSGVSVDTEASVTSAQVTAHVPSPGWDPPVRKVRVCMCVG